MRAITGAGRVLNIVPSLCAMTVNLDLCLCDSPPGRGGERRHGEGQVGQQENLVQPASSSRGSTLPHVQPQEHGECPDERSRLE